MIVKDRLQQVLAATNTLTKTRVLIGIPESEDARDDGEIGNAALGHLHENGSPSQNIPARPFLVPGVKNAQPQITAQMKRAGIAAMNGNQAGVTAALNGAGLVAVNAVKAKVVNGPFVPLSPKTIEARIRKGRNGDKPLLDTTQMFKAITFILRKR